MGGRVAYEFGHLRFEPSNARLALGHRTFRLTGKASETLEMLVRHPDTLLTKDELMGAVWPGVTVDENNLNQQVSALRKLLAHDQASDRIETVPRRGYRFTGPVRMVTLDGPVIASGPDAGLLRGYRVWIAAASIAFVSLLSVSDVPVRRSFADALPSGPSRPSTGRASSIEAEVAYRRGRHFWNKRNPQGFRLAAEEFSRAIELDPKFAPAYAGLADAVMLGSLPDWNGLGWEAWARKALLLDPSLPAPHAMIAYVDSAIRFRWAEAERGFRTAIALDPGYATAHHWYAYHLVALGRFDEALAAIERAELSDPVSPIIASDVGDVLYLSGDLESAEVHARRALEMDSNLTDSVVLLGRILLDRQRFDEAIELWEQWGPRILTKRGRSLIGYAHARAGRVAEARAIRATILAEQRDAAATDLALMDAVLGDASSAVEWLSVAMQRDEGPPVLMAVDPLWASLHGDPGYRRLLASVGLPSPDVVLREKARFRGRRPPQR